MPTPQHSPLFSRLLTQTTKKFTQKYLFFLVKFNQLQSLESFDYLWDATPMRQLLNHLSKFNQALPKVYISSYMSLINVTRSKISNTFIKLKGLLVVVPNKLMKRRKKF